jgi:hypothetical protein
MTMRRKKRGMLSLCIGYSYKIVEQELFVKSGLGQAPVTLSSRYREGNDVWSFPAIESVPM